MPLTNNKHIRTSFSVDAIASGGPGTASAPPDRQAHEVPVTLSQRDALSCQERLHAIVPFRVAQPNRSLF